MPKIAYIEKKLGTDRLNKINVANKIIAEYQAQGFELTLRQLYYQFVARDLIPNNQREYKNLGEVLNDARLAGLVDWEAIVDRTRNLQSLGHWDSPSELISVYSRHYHIDRWQDQPYRPEVWIEKDALVGVIEDVCNRHDVPFFSCRGYTSQSELWAAGRRLASHARAGQTPIVLHFGDHDPSGIDMTRDIEERLNLFAGREIEVRRLALNMNQIEEYSPPPNPCKLTDSRATGYMEKHGDESWELDALDPKVISELIEEELRGLIDADTWQEREDQEEAERHQLVKISENYEKVIKSLKL